MLTSRLGRLSFLGLLYFIQGLPFGIQVGILPIMMREAGASRTTIAYASMLAIPWTAKVFIAPYVERTYSARLGRRRTWILAMQALAFITLLGLAVTTTGYALLPCLVAIFILNTAMATMDIAVDGLAVDVLADDELGPGNAAQVGGYKLGMLFAGGASLQLLRWFSWSSVFVALAAVVAVGLAATLAYDEGESTADPAEPNRPLLPFLARRLVATRASRWFVVLLLTYKAGEALADAQFRPFLVDAGISPEDIGLIAGVYGALASTLGSLVAGAWAARARSLLVVLFIASVLRVVPLAGETLIALAGPTRNSLMCVSLAEHFCGGLVTTVVFALMMHRTDRAHAGTSFTLLATVETLGKGLTGLISGHIADELGDVTVFASATVLSVAFLFVFIPIRRQAFEFEPTRADVSARRSAGPRE